MRSTTDGPGPGSGDSASLARRLCPDVAWCQGQRGRTPIYLKTSPVAEGRLFAASLASGAGPVPAAPRLADELEARPL